MYPVRSFIIDKEGNKYLASADANDPQKYFKIEEIK